MQAHLATLSPLEVESVRMQGTYSPFHSRTPHLLKLFSNIIFIYSFIEHKFIKHVLGVTQRQRNISL